jgi:competence protein ComFB
MDIHNITEDLVIDEVKNACAAIEKEKNDQGICTCAQCRLDAACYVLNRVQPNYIVSGRGLIREERFTLDRQQKDADITTLVYKALKQVGHNQRPFFNHEQKEKERREAKAFFNFPAIVGRIFDGQDFAPMRGCAITLFHGDNLVSAKDANWPNPCYLIRQTEGAYTFWPQSLTAKKLDEHKKFRFTIKAEADGMAPLSHIFEIPVVSEDRETTAFSMASTNKIADLYMFAPDSDD